MTERRRGTEHHSFRLPVAPPKPKPECWRCAEDRRVLHAYRLTNVLNGTSYIVQVCGSCIAGMPRDPDPLDVQPAA